MAGTELYIGLMSGTSIDSIDAALVDLNNDRFQLVAALNTEIPATLQHEIKALCLPGNNEIDRMGAVDRQLGRHFSEAVQQLLSASGYSASQIKAIGSHGQTIRHRPNLGDDSFTLQIGDPNTIAQLTGICTVADFRRRDMAAGGQGAPLAPAFHRAAFSSPGINRVIVNIGGMANATLLADGQPTIGFDTGPGNVLMDGWIARHRGLNYDRDGEWARSGKPQPQLLARLLQHPYLQRATPKSTGREEFNLPWLDSLCPDNIDPADVQATLLDYSAQSIADALNLLPTAVDEVYTCGGGAYNSALMDSLQERLAPRVVASTSALGIAPEWVEGAAFAWLAKQTLSGLPGNLCSVTGAAAPVILGAIYPA